MKRFYKNVSAKSENNRFIICLDNKPIKTPAGHSMAIRQPKLADAVIQEWDNQQEKIDPKTMPLTQLINVKIDKAQDYAERKELEDALLQYINSDLICYYAEGPDSLVAVQRKHWAPLQQIFEEETGLALKTTEGICYVEQHPELEAVGRQYLENLDAAHFAAFQSIVAPLGSFFIAKAFVDGHITAHEAFDAAQIDELHQMETWGADTEVEKKHDALREELSAVEEFLNLISEK